MTDRVPSFLDVAPTPFLLLDEAGMVLRANAAFAALAGRGRETLEGAPLASLLPPGAGSPLPAAFTAAVGAAILRGDGTCATVTLRAARAADPSGAGILLHAAPVPAPREEGVVEVLHRYFETSDEGFVITDGRRRILHVNAAFTRLTGFPREEILGRTPKVLRSGWHDPRYYAEMERQLGERGRWQGEVRDRRRDGELQVNWLTIQALRDDAGAVTHYFGVIEDVTSRKNGRERFNFLAWYDPMTELPNRRLLMERLEHALGKARPGDPPVALLLVDLDRFQVYNASFGHHVGDMTLVAVARRLSECLDVRATVARLEADLFAALIEGRAEDELPTLAALILERLSATFEIEGHQIDTTASVGAALHPRDGATADELFANAEAALARAREKGDACVFYAPEMNARLRDLQRLETKMRRAIRNREFELYLQPQVEVTAGRLLGAEVLLRWRDPEAGMVSPGDFIPLTEETGLIVPIGEWILDTAGGILGRWRKRGGPFAALKLAVNISARQFRDEGLTGKIRLSLSRHGVDPARLELEITESAAMEDAEAVAAVLAAMRRSSGGLSLDDFGTGYSSLSYLKRFPIDKLKIDQSFVRGLLSDPDDTAICRSIIDMAAALKLRVIAEGVETEAQLGFLRDNGCREVQGYLFGRPMPVEAFEEYVEKFDVETKPRAVAPAASRPA